jgi:hypothetical protein
MIFHRHWIMSFIFSGLAIVSVESVVAQSATTLQHVPGELLIGLRSAKYRDSLVRELERDQHHHQLRVGSEKINGLLIKRSGNSGLTLAIGFSDSIKNRMRRDPNVELMLLEKFARQIKLTYPGITYAHPNRIDRMILITAPDADIKLPNEPDAAAKQ